MKGFPILRSRQPQGPTKERSLFAIGARRWPIEDGKLLRSMFGPEGGLDLLGGMTELPFAAKTNPDPLHACLAELRDTYLHAQGLRGNFHFEDAVPGLNVPASPMRSIMEHLVEGALRDNGSDAPFCHVGVAETDPTYVTLYIRDNGRSLPECSVEALRRFVREAKPNHVPDRVYRLFLADNLVQWLGGRMWIGPTPNGVGASVFLRLPRSVQKSV